MKQGLSVLIDNEKIEISNTITQEDKRLWDLMFAHARPYLNSQDRYEIPVTKLIQIWDSEKNEEDLKNAFKRLTFSVKQVVQLRRKKTYRAFAPMPSVSIHDGICYYSYCAALPRLVEQPSIAFCFTLLGITFDWPPKKANYQTA